MKHSLISMMMLASFVTLVFSVIVISANQMEKPFGGKADVEFAKATWMAMGDYKEWPMKSGFYPGKSPHGKVLRLYYNLVDVNGKPYHVIVKDNYDGDNASVETVSRSPEKYLVSVTIMVQREEGYDPEDNNWFWAKYGKDGSLDENAQGVLMAGRIAKGMNVGCIHCDATTCAIRDHR